MLAQLNEELKKSCPLESKGGATGIRVSEPDMRKEGAAKADANGAFVVLVAVVDGTLDEVDRLTDVDGIKDKSL